MSDDPREREYELLQRDLSRLGEPGFSVPSSLDDAILNRARAELARPRTMRRRPLLRWAGAAAAAAACLFLGFILIFVDRTSLEPSALRPDDIDGNHRVDIVDALKLARQIEAGDGRDINGDGAIDRDDVDAIAMFAVRLDSAPIGGVQ